MSDLVIPVAEILALLFRPIRRRVRYLSNFRENVWNLRDEADSIDELRNDVRRRVDVAHRNGQEITHEVSRWLMAVDEVSVRVRQLLERMEDEGYVGFNRCIHFRSIYRMSKEVERIAMSVTELRGKLRSFDFLSPPSPRMMESRFFGDFELSESQRTIVSEVMEALKEDNVNIIGICGMGGMGKTVLVKQVGKQVKESGFFDAVVMAVVSQNPDVRRIQGEIADILGLRLDDGSSPRRADRIFQRLLHERVLVILDDVWNIIDLEEVGIPLMNNSGYGCKVLITSRSLDVCNVIGSQKICSVNALSEEEAWGLFRDVVGDSGESPDLLSVAREIVHECAGLPLAIVTLARTLKNRSIYVWKDALVQLRRPVPERIQGRIQGQLEISYHFLESDEAKSMFLLCCLFPEDADISIDCLMSYGIGLGLFRGVDSLKETRDRVETLVDKLKSSFLLLDSESHGCVRMHVVIRDVGVSIASRSHQFFIQAGDELKKWPENKSITTISLRYKAIGELPNRLEYPNLNLLVLECNHPSLRLPTGFFEGMRELKVLHLSDMHLLSLPSSLQFLVNLRVLFFNNCKLSDLSIIGMLRKLEMLSFSGSDIKELLEVVRQLNRLKSLDLTRCDKLIKIVPQAISSLSRLEVLYMKNCFVEWEIGEEGKESSNASLAELMSLSFLNTLEIHIPDAEFLPESMLFQKLIKFAISIGSRFEEWENYPSSRTLKLVATPLNDRVIALLGIAEAIYLNGFKGLKYDNDNLQKQNFFECEFLRVENCDGIEDIFNIMEENPQNVSFSSSIVALEGGQIRAMPFCKLSILEVIKCRLKYLLSTSSAGCLAQLKELKVKECEILEEILAKEKGDNEAIDKIKFPQLRILRLACLPKFTSFCPKLLVSKEDVENATQPLFNETVAFPEMQELHLICLDNFGKIWQGKVPPGSFSNLRVLEVDTCGNLLNVIPSDLLPRLDNLEKLTVQSCKSLKEVFNLHRPVIEKIQDETLLLSKLSELELINLPKLEHLFSRGFAGTHVLENLKILKVKNCGYLRNLFSPSVARCLKQLNEVEITNCAVMEVVVEEQGGKMIDLIFFPELKFLVLENLPCLTSFGPGRIISKFLSFETLRIKNCSRIKTLFSGFDGETRHHFFAREMPFDRLKELHLIHLGDFQKIWHDILPIKLRVLIVDTCHKLLNPIPPILLMKLNKLRKLAVERCHSLEHVFDIEGHDNDDIEEAYENLLPKLRNLVLTDLPNVSHIFKKDPAEISVFRKLKSLQVINCIGLRYLFSASTTRNLEQLQLLKIFGCEAMEEVIANGGAVQKMTFPKLKSLILKSLPNLTSFCQWNGPCEWPSLEIVRVKGVPKMAIFSPGPQSTPMLKAIYVTFLEKCWKGDLNSTMQHIYGKNGGQHGRIGQKILFDNLKCHICVESSSKVLGEQPSTSQEEIEGVVKQDLKQRIYNIGGSKIHEILEEEEEEHAEEKEEEDNDDDDEKN